MVDKQQVVSSIRRNLERLENIKSVAKCVPDFNGDLLEKTKVLVEHATELKELIEDYQIKLSKYMQTNLSRLTNESNELLGWLIEFHTKRNELKTQYEANSK